MFFPAAAPPSGSQDNFSLPSSNLKKLLQFYIINLEYIKQQEIAPVTWKAMCQFKRLGTCCKALGLYRRQEILSSLARSCLATICLIQEQLLNLLNFEMN